ncbi:MAG: hypothetical protein JWP91_1419 [Fibrobacteres bacterium]|nr:hypothetical protein [Fibrobacterota bacterium]
MKLPPVLILFVSLVAASEGQLRIVLCLIDSGFVVKNRFVTEFNGTRIPDTNQVLEVAKANSTWHTAQLNSKAINDVWLAYEPPADPGTIIFLSNTSPPIALLTLNIDAMCGGCFERYQYYGMPAPVSGAIENNWKMEILELENKFQLGQTLTNQEKASIAKSIRDTLFQRGRDSIQISVLKMRSDSLLKGYPSKDGIRYIAYYRTKVDGTNSLIRAETRTTAKKHSHVFNALGRQIMRGLERMPNR